MRKFCVLLIIAALMLAAVPPVQAANTYPIVLVTGFMGWDRSEGNGRYFFGDGTDIQAYLNSNGYTVKTAITGPLASNWDRACELYAYIKGGRVDYGKVHSQRCGHTRYGKTYSGLYTTWGSSPSKVHLIAHGMAGQASRAMIQLLENGSMDEIYGTPSAELSPLFAGGKIWVSSLTTIATPHDGTSLACDKDRLKAMAQEGLASLANNNNVGENLVFDFKLDQWGLTRQSGESMNDYAQRIFESNVWDNQDFCLYDLTPDGAKAFNTWVAAQDDVYYFSWASERTFTESVSGSSTQDPEPGIDEILQPGADFMGSFTRSVTGKVTIDRTWWQNDGGVNTKSMDGPTLGSFDWIINYSGAPPMGEWNYMGVVSSHDHGEMLGWNNCDMRQWYLDRCAQVRNLSN